MRPSLPLVAATLCVERTSATILLRGFINSWLGAPFFRTPGNVNNVCTSQQKKGWSFDDLDILKPLTEYGGLILDGFSFSDEEPVAKASPRIGRRTLAKHLKGGCGSDHGKPPSISSGDDTKGFSIKQLEVACPLTGSLALRYTMPDGKICQTTSPCEKGKFFVDNDQCGGAVKVSFVYESFTKTDVCWIRLFNIYWDCETSKYPLELPTVQGGGEQGGSSTQTGHQEGGINSRPPLDTGSKAGDISLQTGSEAGKLSLQTGYGNRLPIQTTAAQQLPPASATSFSGGEQADATSTGLLDRIVTAPPAQTTAAYQDLPVPSGEAPFPSFVPSCINTFMKELGMTCKNNLDVGCYCRDKELVRSLYSCFFAHRKDDDEFAKAKEFFRGLCARYIPQNPEIATGAESILASMTITGTPCFEPADYTTVVVPATRVATDGATVTVTTTLAIPEIELPTAVPEAPTGGLDGGYGLEIGPPRPDEPELGPPKVEDEPSLSPPKPDDEAEETKIGELKSDENKGPIVSRPELAGTDEAHEAPGFDSNAASPQTNGPKDGPSPDNSPYESPETTGARSGPVGSTPDSSETSYDTDVPSPRRPQVNRKTEPVSGRVSDCSSPAEAQSGPEYSSPEPEALPEESSYGSPKQEVPSEEPSYSSPDLDDVPLRPIPKTPDSQEADEPQLAPGAETDDDRQLAPQKSVINLKMVPPSATQNTRSTSGPSKTSLGGITVGTGAYAAPAHRDGKGLVSGASRAGLAWAGLTVLGVMVAL